MLQYDLFVHGLTACSELLLREIPARLMINAILSPTGAVN